MNTHTSPKPPVARRLGRYVLALLLLTAGVGHLSWARKSFLAQVPDWVPGNADAIVVLSGLVELALGTALLGVPAKRRKQTGWVVAGFFVAVFPGNISQYLTHTDAFGLRSDTSRAVRLLFQPLLVAWALWATRDPFTDQKIADQKIADQKIADQHIGDHAEHTMPTAT